ncbi:MAG: hypothetical protein HND52_17635 [Ignavibacteriae bacterium]|nr:hypothetical protein [Ignavibacteriota bacterium]NOG99785.1 hypothetical protein [Ignavibacteriota bacterium]
MLIITLITLIILSAAMFLTAKGIERKEKNSIECGLSKFCSIEKLKECSPVNKPSTNYLALTGKANELIDLGK